jgi:hypothetical protein
MSGGEAYTKKRSAIGMLVNMEGIAMPQNSRLTKLQKVRLNDARTVTVLDKFDEGGQGAVYRVGIDGTSEEKALKWYFKLKYPQVFYDNLKENIENCPPCPAFIWPETLTVFAVKGGDKHNA